MGSFINQNRWPNQSRAPYFLRGLSLLFSSIENHHCVHLFSMGVRKKLQEANTRKDDCSSFTYDEDICGVRKGELVGDEVGAAGYEFPHLHTLKLETRISPSIKKKISRPSVSSPPICQSGLTFRSPLNEPMFLPSQSQLSLVSLHCIDYRQVSSQI
jgi:hypothetical protein